MTDQELIGRLQELTGTYGIGDRAADRIEALTKERDEAWKRAAHSEKVWGEAEVKLGKAVELLEEIEVRLKPISGFFFDTFPRREIKAILAEIKGESHE